MPTIGAIPRGLVGFSGFLDHVRHPILLLAPDLRVVAFSPATQELVDSATLSRSLEEVGSRLGDPLLAQDCSMVLNGSKVPVREIRVDDRGYNRRAGSFIDRRGEIAGVAVALEPREGESGSDRSERASHGLEDRVDRRTRSLIENQRQLRALASQLTFTEQRERRRLATELHDYLSQLLVTCKIRVGQMTKAQGNPKKMEELLEHVEGILNESLEYTRTLVAELSPTILYDAGLAPAINWLAEKMKQYDLEVTVVTSGDPPELPEDHAVVVFQVVRELLMNVVKHGDVSRARVFLAAEEGKLVVRVEDQGRGFSPESVLRDPASSGRFGLFNIRERIEALGGDLEVDSAPGRGCRIKVLLPTRSFVVPQAPGPSHAAASPRAKAFSPPSTLGRIRVLLADDHDLWRTGLRSMIEGWAGVEVVGEARNGKEAIELSRSLRPDVVLMDIGMPVTNGIEATRVIRDEVSGVRVIGLSIKREKEIAETMLAAGACAFLTKDSSEEDLRKAFEASVKETRA